jgi:hypothetical protein
MAAKIYRLKIARGGYEFEAEGDKSFVMDMLKRFVPPDGPEVGPGTKQKDASKPESKKTNDPTIAQAGVKTISIREFIQKFGFKRHTDIVVAFAYYLEKHSGVSEFTPADINNCYYEAKLEGSNTSQMVIRNIKRGYIMQSKKKGKKGRTQYTLTSTGEEFIKSKLSDKR